ARALRDQASLHAEFVCARADGKSVILDLHLVPAPSPTPDRPRAVVLGRDISARSRARRMQESVQRLLTKVFMSVDDAVVIVNATGQILMTNARVDALLGYQPNELLGRWSLDLVAPEARESIAATIKRQMETGADQTYGAPLMKADDTTVRTAITSTIV